jgi:hypothetical protein
MGERRCTPLRGAEASFVAPGTDISLLVFPDEGPPGAGISLGGVHITDESLAAPARSDGPADSPMHMDAAVPALSVTQPSPDPAEDDAEVDRSLTIEWDEEDLKCQRPGAPEVSLLVRGGLTQAEDEEDRSQEEVPYEEEVLYGDDEPVAGPSYDKQAHYLGEV